MTTRDRCARIRRSNALVRLMRWRAAGAVRQKIYYKRSYNFSVAFGRVRFDRALDRAAVPCPPSPAHAQLSGAHLRSCVPWPVGVWLLAWVGAASPVLAPGCRELRCCRHAMRGVPIQTAPNQRPCFMILFASDTRSRTKSIEIRFGWSEGRSNRSHDRTHEP